MKVGRKNEKQTINFHNFDNHFMANKLQIEFQFNLTIRE